MSLRRLGKALALVPLVAVGAILVTGAVPLHGRTELPAGVEGRWVEVLGSRLRVAQSGRGPDILLIHGSPGSIEDWQPIRDRLTGAFRVTAFDRPGHGYSGSRDPVSVADNARVALALVEQLRLRDVTVVGHSFGGAVALALAVERPPAIRAYVSVGGALRVDPGGSVESIYRVIALPVIGRGVARLSLRLVGPGQVARGVREAFAPNLDAMPDGFLERVKPLWLTTTGAVTTARERAGIGREQARDLAPRYRSIVAPLVLVHGRADRLVPVEQAAAVKRQVPRARLHVLDGVGHYVQYARPDELAAIIRAAALR